MRGAARGVYRRASVFRAIYEKYPKRGVRDDTGFCSGHMKLPRAKRTVVRVVQSLPVEEKQEMSFLGLWWLVDEVQYDLTSVNSQAAGAGRLYEKRCRGGHACRKRTRGGIGEHMDIGFLFGWAEEEGVDLPTKADGSIKHTCGIRAIRRVEEERWWR